MSDEEITQRLELARTIALEAGDVTLKYFQRGNFQVERKADDSPVTIADRQAEEHLRGRISAAFPADGIVGEEFDAREGTSDYRWILDPIDGTKSFVSGVPLYGTLIGVEHGGRAVIGVIHMPGLDETIYAASGRGAWHVVSDEPPVQARVSDTNRLSAGLFCLSEFESFADCNRHAALARLQQAAWLTRTWGDCYGYLLVATGRAALMVDPVMHVWDAAALQPVLEEAGGTFTDWSGTPTIHGGEGVGTNGHVLAEVLETIRGR